MDYIQLLQKRINSISENAIERDIFDEFFKLEKVIVDMQQNQISQHQGFDDAPLQRKSGKTVDTKAQHKVLQIETTHTHHYCLKQTETYTILHGEVILCLILE